MDWVIAGATAALAVVGASSFGVSIWLAVLTRRAVDAAVQGARAAARAAAASERQASLTAIGMEQDAHLRTQRAAARLDETGAAWPAADMASPPATVDLRNHGPGDAYQVVVAASPKPGATRIGALHAVLSGEAATVTLVHRADLDLSELLEVDGSDRVVFYADVLGNLHRRRPGQPPEMCSPVEQPQPSWTTIWRHAGKPLPPPERIPLF